MLLLCHKTLTNVENIDKWSSLKPCLSVTGLSVIGESSWGCTCVVKMSQIAFESYSEEDFALSINMTGTIQ